MNTKTRAINKSTEDFRRYLNDIRKYDVMMPEQEKAAFKRYRAGDISARDEIIMSNQRFVLSMAKKFSTDTEEILCLVNEGNIGLMKAIDKYDPATGYRFYSYAVNWISQTIHLYLDYVKRPIYRTNEIKVGRRADKIRNEYYVKNGWYPSDAEIISTIKEKYGIEVKNSSDISDCKISSLDEPVADTDFNMMDVGEIADRTSSQNAYEKTICDEANKTAVEKLLTCLSERDREIIKKSYGIGCDPSTNEDIAEMFNMCETRINQIKREAVNKMAKYAKTAI